VIAQIIDDAIAGFEDAVVVQVFIDKVAEENPRVGRAVAG
jgi:hypothetical protein